MRVIIFLFVALLATAVTANEKKIVCYFGSWAVYRPGDGGIKIEDIDPKLCTHLIYTFVGLNDDGGIRILDPWGDLAHGKDGFNKFNQLRGRSPSTKTLIAIGGWNEGSEKYSKMVSKPEKRKAFVDNAVSFVRQYGFDGLDFDWEYPNQRGGVEADKKNYILLLKELRERFDKEGLLITAAVGAIEKSASLSYIIPEVSKYLHFVNLMAYDMHGKWDEQTGINAPLYPGNWEKHNETLLMLNVNASVNYWISQGAPAEKLVLGIPFYGRSFTLKDVKQNGIGAPAEAGKKGPYTREEGSLGYNEICEMQKKGKWEVHWQNEQRVPYAFKGDQWVGYENPRSIYEKAELVEKLGLGGAMIWSIETDDFKGVCGSKYPLLTMLNHVLRGGPPLPKPTTPKPPTEINCTAPGYIRDPDDCAVFYLCVPVSGKGFQKHKLSCSGDLVFDLETESCEDPSKVDCSAPK